MDLEHTIEKMTQGDLTRVATIESLSYDHPWARDTFEAELRHSWSHCDVMRRTTDNVIVGYIIFWCVADEVHLLNICVDPEARHQALGRRLLDHMTGHAVRTGARLITLEVRASNKAAIRLYETSGFQRVGIRPRYYANNGEDAIVMLHELDSQADQTSTTI